MSVLRRDMRKGIPVGAASGGTPAIHEKDREVAPVKELRNAKRSLTRRRKPGLTFASR